MRIALVVDNPYRDLPGLVLLAVRLARQGAECYLVPYNLADWRGRELWALAPDFVLLNFLRPNNQHTAERLLDAGVGVGVLDTEGGVLDSLDTYARTLPPDQGLRHRITCYCSWGAKIAEHARKADWYRDRQVVVTGAPRFDFYAPQWSKVALRSSPYADLVPRPLVLINGNFPTANPAFQTPEQEAEMLADCFGYDLASAVEYQRVQRETMVGLTGLVNRLAARFPRATFIYRPHPFERLESYHDLLEKRDNIHLLRRGTVDGWILRASAVIQRSCSTAIEAGLAGVPSLLPAWIPSAQSAPDAEEVSLQCQSEQELVQTLAAILAGEFELPAVFRGRLDQVIEDWFCRIDGRAHERVADQILGNLPTDDRRRRLRACRYQAHAWPCSYADSWKRRTGIVLKEALGLSVHWSFRTFAKETRDLSWWPRLEKYFDASHVQALVDAIEQHGPDPVREGGRVGVRASRERDYHFGYLEGQSVTLFPK